MSWNAAQNKEMDRAPEQQQCSSKATASMPPSFPKSDSAEGPARQAKALLRLIRERAQTGLGVAGS